MHEFFGDGEGVEANVSKKGRKTSPLEYQKYSEGDQHADSKVVSTVWMKVGPVIGLKESPGACVVVRVYHSHIEGLSPIAHWVSLQKGYGH